MVDYLMLNGVDLNAVTANGLYPLNLAIQLNKTEAAKKVILAGADISLRTKEGYAALDYAQHYKNDEVFQLINVMAKQAHDFPISASHPLQLECLQDGEIKKNKIFIKDNNIKITYSKAIEICNEHVGRGQFDDIKITQLSINDYLDTKHTPVIASIFEGYNYTKVYQKFITECTKGKCGEFLNDDSLDYDYYVAHEYFVSECMK